MARQPFNIRWSQNVEGESSSTVFQDPGASRLATGWEGGADKDAPPAGQENWWHNRVDSALQDLERYGAMTWIASAVYAIGAPVKSLTDGNYYESLVPSNTGFNPVSTNGYWRLIGSSLYGVLPVGMFVDVAHNGIPDVGFLKANGAVVNISSYPRLYAKIGTTWNTGGEAGSQFRLPDTRVGFRRSFADGSASDPGRVFGAYQGSSIGSHSHDLQGEVVGGTGRLDITGQATVADAQGKGTITPYGNTLPFGGSETRPANYTAATWIKY